ncbi:MAG: hypothetical protein NVSMB27_23350 [Ktedonobacteraceae bacterium]
MIPNRCIEVQTSPVDRPSVPAWFAEVVMIVRHLETQGVRTRTTVLQMHTRQWVGTYAGKGNGDYRGELASALRAITAYLKHFAFLPEMALIRLDGAYGDATTASGQHPFRDTMERIFAPGASPDPARAGSCTDGEHGEDEQRCGRRVV